MPIRYDQVERKEVRRTRAVEDPSVVELRRKLSRRTGLTVVTIGVLALGVKFAGPVLDGARSTGAFFGSLMGSGQEQVSTVTPDYERLLERCVSDLVGRRVDLVPDPVAGGLQHPASVITEQAACEANHGNVADARQYATDHPVALAPQP